MRVSVSYNRTRVRVLDNADGEYFLYTRPLGELKPTRFVYSNGHVMDDLDFTTCALGTSVITEYLYITYEIGKEEDHEG